MVISKRELAKKIMEEFGDRGMLHDIEHDKELMSEIEDELTRIISLNFIGES